MSYTFVNEYVKCVVTPQEDKQLVVSGAIENMHQFESVEILAANPIDRMISYSGSGLPFPCANIAFEGTPNYKKINGSETGAFRLYFMYPNSYYTEDGLQRVPPSIFFIMHYLGGVKDPMYVRFELPIQDAIMNVRTLTYRNMPRKGPHIYNMKETEVGICGAEETMRRYRDIKLFKDLV
jgi:hypothetical protein